MENTTYHVCTRRVVMARSTYDNEEYDIKDGIYHDYDDAVDAVCEIVGNLGNYYNYEPIAETDYEAFLRGENDIIIVYILKFENNRLVNWKK